MTYISLLDPLGIIVLSRPRNSVDDVGLYATSIICFNSTTKKQRGGNDFASLELTEDFLLAVIDLLHAKTWVKVPLQRFLPAMRVDLYFRTRQVNDMREA